MNRNKQIMLILYFIVIIFLFIQLYDLYSVKSEYFYDHDTDKIHNKDIRNILMSPDENEVVKFYGTYTGENKDKVRKKKLYQTYSLESDTWNNSTDFNYTVLDVDEIIYDITYDKNQHMIIIGVKYDTSEDKHVYNTYITDKPIYNINSDNKGNFILIGENNDIKSICYDNRIGEFLGLNSRNGQIYIYEKDENPTPTETSATSATSASSSASTASMPPPDDYVVGMLDKQHWKGPINQDIPLKKIMYSKENQLIGIGLFDSFIYKKEGSNWKYEKWDRVKINKTKVHDLIYNYDGCLIGTSRDYKGIIKQTNPELSSEFKNVLDYKFEKRKYILSLHDILKAKIGYEFEDILFTDNSVEAEALKKIYDTKKDIIGLCENSKYRKYENKVNENEDPIDDIGYKHKEIRNLYEEIEQINIQMTK